MFEPLTEAVGIAIDIEMVGVDTGYDSHVRAEIVEAAIVFVGFDNDIVAVFGEEKVGSVIVADTSEEGIGIDVGLIQEVSKDGAGSGFSVSACNAEGLHAASDITEHFCPFLYEESLLTEPGELQL